MDIELENILSHPSQKILDGTKLSCFKLCPRKYLYTYIFGFRPSGKSQDLIYGGSGHLALEHLYEDWKTYRAFRPEAIEQAKEIFIEDYRRQLPPESDELFQKKKPLDFPKLLDAYVSYYAPIDHFSVIYTEISGSLPIGRTPAGTDKRIYYRLDTVIEQPGGMKAILEHKFSGWGLQLWATSMELSTQASIGAILTYILYGPESAGIIFNGIFPRSPRYKKDGTLYANSREHEFLRLPINRQIGLIETFRAYEERWYDAIQRELDLLISADISDQTVSAFPPNCSSCLSYNRTCEFHHFCSGISNPLTLLPGPPVGFQQEFWDTRQHDKSFTTHINLEEIPK